MKNIPKFQKGDILKALPNKNSNYFDLKRLVKVKVVNNDLSPSYSKKLISLLIIEGTAYGTHHNADTYKCVGDVFQAFEDAFELIIPEEEDYSIF